MDFTHLMFNSRVQELPGEAAQFLRKVFLPPSVRRSLFPSLPPSLSPCPPPHGTKHLLIITSSSLPLLGGLFYRDYRLHLIVIIIIRLGF
jgi:hypothetical protein